MTTQPTDRIAFASAGAVRKRPLDESRYDDGPLQNNGSPFMRFWKLLNDLMRSREQPELLYGEANDLWREYEGLR